MAEQDKPSKRVQPRIARRKDVAELAQVSPSTVSLVLNNTPGPRIPDATRQRIIDAANQLGYQPNAVARALVTGKTMTIGVVFHYIGNPFYDTASSWLNGAWSVFHPHEYRILLGEGDEEKPLAGLYRQRGVDGMLMLVPPTSPEDQDKELQFMIEADFPCCAIGARLKADIGDYVDTDNFGAAKMMTEKLIQAGHKRIMHITGPHLFNSSAMDRLNGYKQALKENGIEIDESLIRYGNYTGTMGEDLLNEAMDEGVKFTAIFAANASTAHFAIKLLRKRGLDVPKDVSITAIDRPYQNEPLDYELVTYQQDTYGIGKKAGELLLERIMSDEVLPSRNCYVEGTFIDGNTIHPV